MKSFGILVFLAFCYLAVADYRREALQQHNDLRAIHDAPSLRLSSDLNRQADRYARELFDKLGCFSRRLVHSNTRGQGENLAFGWTTARVDEARSAQDSIKSWYDEVCLYDFNRPGFSLSTGHFTQLVWKDSSELGIGKYTGRGQKAGKRDRTCTFIVARYKGSGNVNSADYFRRNVLKGSFRRSYCRTVDKPAEDDIDAPEGSTMIA
ncbi:Golgi-associated plant pathogenesis-related protein 1-like [Oculina patagonica]